MSETTYIKTFLQTLDSKPTKYPADHIFDPKTFPPRVPYTLPRLPHPPHPLPSKNTPIPTPAPGSTSSDLITINLKSTRNPVLSTALKDASPTSTSIAQLKETVVRALGEPPGLTLDKVKILYNKKPVPAGKKTVVDVLEGETAEKEIELGVMIIGGASISVPTSASATQRARKPVESIKNTQSASSATPAQGPSGVDVLQSEEFWNDLQGFLEQRLKNEAEARKLQEVFRNAWTVRSR